LVFGHDLPNLSCSSAHSTALALAVPLVFVPGKIIAKKALKQTGENKGSSRENKKLTILAGTQMRFWHMTNK
jgi:hypothetical protein